MTLNNPLKIGIVCGEHSGDRLGAELITELKNTGVETLTLITPGIKTRMYDEINKLYGDHMDLDFLSSISPEQYANEVCDTVEAGKQFYWPKDMSMKAAMWIAQHTPGLYRKLIEPKFKR